MKTQPNPNAGRPALLSRRWSLSTGQLTALLAGAVLLSAGCATLAQREAAMIFQNQAMDALFKGGGVMQCTGLRGPESRCTTRVGVNNLKAQISGELSAGNAYYMCRPGEERVYNETTARVECVPLKFDEAR